MTLLYIHQYFVFPDTPGATRSYDLATYFAAKGMRVIVITSSSFLEGTFNKRWTVIHRDNIEVHVLRSRYSNQLSYLRRMLVFLTFMWQTTVRALKIKADVVLATSTPITVGVPALVKKLFQRTPFVFEVRDVWPEAPIAIGVLKHRMLIRFLEWFEQFIYRHASHIVALSVDMKKSIAQRTGTKTDKITVIPNIANLERFANGDSGKSMLRQSIGFVPKRSLLYAGALGIMNGLHVVIELAKHTRTIDPDLIYVFTGWGVRKQQLTELAEREGLLGSTVFFLPPIPKNIIPQLYAECTVTSSFVLPVKELWANSANKFFDSLAAGKPIVINYEGWQAQLVRGNSVGYVLPFQIEDMHKAAKDFCTYINDVQLLATQSVNARNLANEFLPGNAGQSYLNILEKLNAHVNEKTRDIR